MRRKDITKEQLYALYIDEKMGTPEIARRLGVSVTSINKWLHYYNIPVRSNSIAQQVKRGTDKLTSSLLRSLYWDEGLLQSEIAKKYNITQTAVGYRMRKDGIPTRGKAHFGDKNGMYGRSHTPEALAKIRAANERQFSDPEARRRHALLTCKQIQDGRTGKAYNKLERRISAFFDEKHIEYIQQYRVDRYLFDFFLPKQNALIEAQGRFWHADPRFYSPDSLSVIQKRNISNDIRKAVYALHKGFSIYYLWEDDVNANNIVIPFSSPLPGRDLR